VECRKFFLEGQNQNATYQNLGDATKAMCRGKSLAVKV
jgi:hypothetical protein